VTPRGLLALNLLVVALVAGASLATSPEHDVLPSARRPPPPEPPPALPSDESHDGLTSRNRRRLGRKLTRREGAS
jgi:hypothetical protein